MKKKILFMSSAKLTAFSIGLLLAVFCTIGMSFRPVYGEDEVEIVMSGPRHSHWHWETGTCTTTQHYQSSVDNAVTKVQTRGFGSVTISTTAVTNVTVPSSGNPRSATSGTEVGNEASISWNSGLSHADQTTAKYTDAQISEAHKKGFTITATPISDDYYFAGWGTTTSESSINNYDNPRTITSDMGISGYSNTSSQPANYATKTFTDTYYAFFKERVPANITLNPAEHGSIQYAYSGVAATTVSSQVTFSTKHDVTLTATPESGYEFYGWYTLDGSTEEFFSKSSSYVGAFPSDITIYAKFVLAGSAYFTLKGTDLEFYDFRKAIDAANKGSNKVIVPIRDGSVYAGDYTIPSGVTLLLPYDDAYTLKTTDPGHAYAAPAAQSKYRKLILKSNVNIIVQSNGAISVSATSQGGQPYGGCVHGKYGQIDMASGSTITLNSGAYLYCWGYITGAGEITAKSGSTVYEDFQIACWRGGTAASGMNNNSKKVFPLAQYYIQNVEAKMHIEAGASEYVWTSVSASNDAQRPSSAILLIGTSSGLFQMSSGRLTKWFNATDDRQMYELAGNMTLGSISMKIYVTINSANYVLPLTNNMDIRIKSGTMTCNQKIAILPGAKITIDEGASVAMGSSSELYVYDKGEWPNDGASAFNYNNVSFKKVNYTATSITTARTYTNMKDAILDINGTLTTASGNFYTTSSKADVCSSNGTGKVIWTKAPASSTPAAGSKDYTYQATQGGSGGTTITYVSIPITPAQLHNSTAFKTTYGDAYEYLATAGAAANTTITYANGHWGWVEIWKNGNTVLKVSNTCVKVNNATASGSPALSDYALTGHTASWTTTENNTNQEVIHTITNTPITYNITLNTNEGTINSGNVTSYTYGVGATLPSDVKRANHIFEGWFDNSGLTGSQVETISTTATGDKKFWAKWTLNAADITWKVDGKADEVTPVAYGSNPVYPSGTPSKDPGYDYTYTFEGWSDGTNTYAKDATLPAVTGPATYTALFQYHLLYYTVTWKNWDGTILETDQDEEGGMQYGATPSYDGKTPTKDGDGKRFYTFKGWYPEIEENSVDGDKEYVAQYNMSIAVDENDGPLEITTDETAVTTTVQIAGKLNVAPAATLTTEDLILEGTPNSSGEIIIGGTVTATRAYFDFSNGTEGFKARTWYAVAVPWQVDVPAYDKEHNGVYIKTDEGDFVQQELGQTFDLIYYDGALRASQGVNKAWNYVEDDQLEHSKHYVMMPGRAYMIYLTADAQTIRFERKEGADLLTNTLAVETYDLGTGNGKDANWNGIANPATYHAYINASVKNYTTDVMNVGQVYDAKTKKYSVVNMSTQSLVVGQPIFVQATESNASVVAYADKNDAFHAPRRAAKAAASLTRYELYLAPSMDIATDQIVVRMNEGKEDDVYTVGQDLVKMGVSDLVPQMWIDRYDSKMCINTVAPVDNTADYPLGIFVPKNGEYDIFLDDEPDSKSTLYLTYDGEAIWNLSNGAYVANLEKGTNTHYGLRISAKSPQIATGIDEAVVDAQGDTRKVMINETVYIIRGGKVYSADGQLVK